MLEVLVRQQLLCTSCQLHQRGCAPEGGDKPKRGRPSNIVRAAAAAAAAAAATEAQGHSHEGEVSPSRGPPPRAPERRPYHQARFTGSASSPPPAPPLSPERLSQVSPTCDGCKIYAAFSPGFTFPNLTRSKHGASQGRRTDCMCLCVCVCGRREGGGGLNTQMLKGGSHSQPY